MTRAEYMVWSKQRALALVDEGDHLGALASIIGDLRDNPETDGPHLGPLMLVGAQSIDDPAGMRRFIEGFA